MDVTCPNWTYINVVHKGIFLENYSLLTVYPATQNICITFVQRRPNVFDAGPTLYKCYIDALCLLGSDR